MVPLAFLVGDTLFGQAIVQLALAVVLGGAVGLERELHGRPAGLRTHIMVCLGATIAMLSSVRLYELLPNASGGSALHIDPGRIAAGIVTGIGFIGAGAIMRLKSANRGLTTAATIWFVAALGVVIGVGAYAVAVAGTLTALAVLMLLMRVEGMIRPDTYREITIVADRSEDLLDQVRAVVSELEMTVQSHEFEEELEKNQIRAVFNVRFRRAHLGEEVLRRLRAIPGVRTIGWRAIAS
jgi:putative Mg2+ transporter-C (MgtC) family protein